MSDQNSNRPTPNFDLANKQTQEKEAVQEPLTEIAMEDIATEEDIMWMRHALTLADKAESIGEVPVGACVVLNGELIGEGFNTPITDNDPSAHAELRAVKEAAAAVQNYRLIDATLYVTLEPCAMCAGAIVLARIPRIVFAAFDPKGGACGTLRNVVQDERLNHRCAVQGGLLESESAELLKAFFARLRQKKR